MLDNIEHMERHRVRSGLLGSDASYGRNGAFLVPTRWGRLQLIVSDQEGWEHVSCTFADRNHIPTWKIMCFVKDLFWGPEEVVVQYHPADSEYINCHPNVLHLWRPTDQAMPTPPPYMVGPITLKET